MNKLKRIASYSVLVFAYAVFVWVVPYLDYLEEDSPEFTYLEGMLYMHVFLGLGLCLIYACTRAFVFIIEDNESHE